MDALGIKLDAVRTARARIDEFFDSRTTIDKLMCEKVDDYILIEEMPTAVKIGNRTLYVGNFTLDNQHKFFKEYPKVLANVGLQCINFELLGNKEGSMYRALSNNKKLHKELCKLLKKTILSQQWYYVNQMSGVIKYKLPKMSLRYFMKNITVEKLIQVCFLVYLYNFDAVKKNLKVVLEKMDAGTVCSETYMYGWLKNLAGMQGNFLLSQLTNSGSSASDSLIEITQALRSNRNN